MAYIGDFRLGDTFDTSFCTVQSTGAPFTLAGSPVISAYVGNSTTEITAGITLTVDFDSRTGLNHVRVVATSGNGFATASNYRLVITTGTVNSVSAVGYVVAEFSIENRSALMPTTATRTLDVASTGEAGLDYSNVLSYVAGPFAPTAVIDSGTAQSATGTTLVLRAAAAFADSELVGATIVIRSATTGAGQRRLITANVGSTDTCTVDAWTTTPTGTIVYDIFGSAPGSTTSPAPVNTTQFAGQTITAAAGVTIPSSIASPTNITAAIGVALSPTGLDGPLDSVDGVETALSMRGYFKLAAAVLFGKASGLDTVTAVFRNAVADSKARVTATVDANGNRTAVTTDAT